MKDFRTTCKFPQLFVRGLGAANFLTTPFDFGGSGGGCKLAFEHLKDGLALLIELLSCCLTILLPTAAATRQPLLVSLFRPLGARGGGGGLEQSSLYGTGISFEVEAETT